jgi:hypothetical protein
MLAGWALFSDRALKWTPGTVKLTAIVSHPATLQYIREGHTNLLLAQQVYEWGVRPVDLLFDAVQNGKYPATWFIKISLLPVTKDNVDDLYTRWKGWLQGKSKSAEIQFAETFPPVPATGLRFLITAGSWRDYCCMSSPRCLPYAFYLPSLWVYSPC